MLQIEARVYKLHPRRVFRISRADEAYVENVILQLTENNVTALGEASPNAFYNETAEIVRAKLLHARTWIERLEVHSPKDIARAWRESWEHLGPSRAAQCALDVALWDLLAKKNGVSVTELATGRKPRKVKSFCTIGLSTQEELSEKVPELRENPFIKIKMDGRADLDTVRYVRERCSGKISVDANCSWTAVDLAKVSRSLADLGVEFIEQPLPPEETVRMPDLLRASALPIIADESCVLERDVDAIPHSFSGFNIKLVKCGGLTPGLRMLEQGKKLGLKTMVGCMLETSVLISAGGVVGQQTDYADLDGAWLLRDDPFEGPRFDVGVLELVDAAGLGVSLRDGV